MVERAQSKNTSMRAYTLADIPQMVDVIKKELPGLPNYAGLPVDEEFLRFILTNNVKSQSGFVSFVLLTGAGQGKIVGGIAAHCATSMFNRNLKVANDTILWVDPEFRTFDNAKKLIMAYVEWAKSRRAAIIGASFTSGFEPEGMQKLLERLGFVEIGKLFHYRLV